MAGNFAYLSTLSGGSELYKGEAGAQVMQNLNAGFERATSLGGTNDVLTYRAAQKVIDRWKNSENPAERKKYDDLFDIDGKPGRDIKQGDSWIDASLLLDKGFNPELFDETIKDYELADMSSRRDVIGRIAEQFSMNPTQAAYLYDKYKDNGKTTMDDYKKALEIAPKEAPRNDSNELNYLKLIEGFKNTMSQFGQEHFDKKIDELPEKIETMLKKLGIGESTGEETDLTGKPAALNPDYGIMDWDFLNGEQTRANAGLYTQGFFGKDKDDKNAKRKIDDMLASAYTSGDENQVKNALSIRDVFSAVPQNVREEMDKNNTINALAETNNIEGLLRMLIDVVKDNGNTKVILEN